MKYGNRCSDRSTAGFTLVELIITMVISTVIGAAIFSAYLVQQKTYLAQEQVAEMQQNLRAAMMVMTADFRMAGYDGEKTGKYGITTAEEDKFVFTSDLNDNGGDPTDTATNPGEILTYELYVTGDGKSAIRRFAGQGAIAENIVALEFQYLDGDGAVLPAPVTTDIPKIRAVNVSMLARADQPDRNFTNSIVYTPASGTPFDLNAGPDDAANDNFRRRLLITTINFRNMGIM